MKEYRQVFPRLPTARRSRGSDLLFTGFREPATPRISASVTRTCSIILSRATSSAGSGHVTDCHVLPAPVAPLAVLLVALAALWASGIAGHLNWATLGRYQAALARLIDRHPIASPALYAAIYAVATALSLPEGAVLTVAGGLLFGALLGGAMAVIGATAGALVLFLTARSAFAATLATRGDGRLARIRSRTPTQRLQLPARDPADLGVPVLAGEPGRGARRHAVITVRRGDADRDSRRRFVYAWIGAGIGSVLAAGRRPDLTVVVFAADPRPAGDARRARAAAGGVAVVETAGWLTSTSR